MVDVHYGCCDCILQPGCVVHVWCLCCPYRHFLELRWASVASVRYYKYISKRICTAYSAKHVFNEYQ